MIHYTDTCIFCGQCEAACIADHKGIRCADQWELPFFDRKSACEILLDESAIPVSEPVRGACELLGLDPLYVANEGRFIAMLPGDNVERALRVVRSTELGEGACAIGQVTKPAHPQVSVRTILGVERIVDLLTGEQLPRIC